MDEIIILQMVCRLISLHSDRFDYVVEENRLIQQCYIGTSNSIIVTTGPSSYSIIGVSDNNKIDKVVLTPLSLRNLITLMMLLT